MGHVTRLHLCGTGPGSVQAELRVVGGLALSQDQELWAWEGWGTVQGGLVLLPEPLDTGRISVCPKAQRHTPGPRHAGLGGFENLHVLEGFSTGPARASAGLGLSHIHGAVSRLGIHVT